MTHCARRLTTSLCLSCLLCVLLSCTAPVSLSQKLKPADVSALLNDLKGDDAKGALRCGEASAVGGR